MSLGAFIYVELKRTAPLLNLRLLARRNFGLGTCANFISDSPCSVDLSCPAVSVAHAGLQLSGDRRGDDLDRLPQLLLIPFLPKIMQRVDSRWLVISGYSLFIAGSLAMRLSDDFSGPQFLGSSLVRALAQVMTMAPLSAIAIAGIEPEQAGSASALLMRCEIWAAPSGSPRSRLF